MRVVAGTRPRLIGCRPFAPSPQLGEGRAAGSTAWRHRIDSGKRTLNRNASPVLDPPQSRCAASITSFAIVGVYTTPPAALLVGLV